MATVFQFMAPVAILGLTWLVRRGQPISVTALGAGLLNVIGCAGIAYLPAQTAASTAWLWSALIGLGTSAIFTLCIMLFSLRTHTTDQARDLSGMAQTVGYLIAFFGPLGAGWLHEQTHNWDMALNAVFVLMVINLGFAWLASRPKMIDGTPV